MRRPREELMSERSVLLEIMAAERRRRDELREQAARFGYRTDPARLAAVPSTAQRGA